MDGGGVRPVAGDIFYPPLEGSWRKVPNWNSAIVRTHTGEKLLEEAVRGGCVTVSPLDENVLYGNIGFEAKKHGAVYKLQKRKRYGWPTPRYGYSFWSNPEGEPISPSLRRMSLETGSLTDQAAGIALLPANDLQFSRRDKKMGLNGLRGQRLHQPATVNGSRGARYGGYNYFEVVLFP